LRLEQALRCSNHEDEERGGNLTTDTFNRFR